MIAVALARGAAVRVHRLPDRRRGTAVRSVGDPVPIRILGLAAVVTPAHSEAESHLSAIVDVMAGPTPLGAPHVVCRAVHPEAEARAQSPAKSSHAGEPVIVDAHVLAVHVPDIPGADPKGRGIAAQWDVVGQP